jgi:hypothetical protein
MLTAVQRQVRIQMDQVENAVECAEKLPKLDDWLLPNSA